MSFARPLTAGLDPSSVAAIRAALDRHEPIGLLSDRLPAIEREALTARLAAAPVPDGTAFVVFTSGSTGRPKGVVLSRDAARAAVSLSESHLGRRSDDRWLLALSPAQVGGLGVLTRCWLGDVPLTLAGGADASRVAAAMNANQPTLVSLVPTQLSSLLTDPDWRPPPSLRAVLLGGAAAADTLLTRARARGVPVLTTYGMSETFGQVATAPPGSPPPGAIGRPLAGVTLTAGTRADPATILIETPAAFSGYLGEAPRSGPVVTSDLGFVEDGWLHVVGRADDIIITGGHKLHPQPIESALSLPGVAAIAVTAIPDPHWGQLVCAAIVPGPTFDRAALAAAIASLPSHHRPRHVAIVDALPLLPSGKLDRAAVSAIIAAASEIRPNGDRFLWITHPST